MNPYNFKLPFNPWAPTPAVVIDAAEAAVYSSAAPPETTGTCNTAIKSYEYKNQCRWSPPGQLFLH